MSMKREGDTITCDCGFSFQRGHSGKHECADGLRAKLSAALRREESLKANTDVLARRIAELEPIGCIKTICGNKTLKWWRDAPEGAEVFTAPPTPAVPDEIMPDGIVYSSALPEFENNDSDKVVGYHCLIHGETRSVDSQEQAYADAELVVNACRAAMLQPVSQSYTLPEGCKWTYDEHDYKWDSACGESWQFTDGGPEDNGVKFCQGCGKPVVLAAAPTPTK